MSTTISILAGTGVAIIVAPVLIWFADKVANW